MQTFPCLLFVLKRSYICMIKLSLEVKNDQGSKQEIIRNAKTSGDIISFADSSLSLVKCCLNR